MNIFSGIVVFVLIWWMIFFCTLPFGIRNIEQPKDGSMPGAPVDPGLLALLAGIDKLRDGKHINRFAA